MSHSNDYTDFKFNDFVTFVYKSQPKDPFTYNLEFLEEKANLKQLLAYFVVTGAKTKYSKELAELAPEEIEHLRKYLHSIGFDVKFEVQQKMKKIKPNEPEIPVNFFLIDFFPLNPSTQGNCKQSNNQITN